MAETQRFLVKIVGNSEQSLLEYHANESHDHFLVTNEGFKPVRPGRVAPGGWRVWRGNDLWFSVDQADGVTELCRETDGWRWYVDTPGARVMLPGALHAWSVRDDGRENALPDDPLGWETPPGAVLMHAR
jgi:hypothetical protein